MTFPEKNESMDRHEALRPLSRHHMVALLLVLNLSRIGTAKEKYSAKEMQAEVKKFWLPDGVNHFREEEEIVLTAYAKHAEVDIPEIQEMLIEHVKLRALIEVVIDMKEIDVAKMYALGELLEIHVRKEERVLFPLFERTLPEEVLAEIAPYLA